MMSRTCLLFWSYTPSEELMGYRSFAIMCLSLSTKKAVLPNFGLLYPELQEEYQQYIIVANTLCDQYMATILDIIKVLQQKKSDMINEALTVEFSALVDQLFFDYKGMCYCKKLVHQNNGLLLVSLNKGYTPIPVESFDEYHLFGEVVEIIPSK